MSKTYGLAGLRIGWVATQDADVLQKMAMLKDYTTICSSAPSEFLATVALKHRQQLAQRNIDLIQRNLRLLDGFFQRQARLFRWVRPRAGSIAFPRYLGGGVEAFCHDLVTHAGVLLLPGTLFGDREDHFRLGFGRANAPEAIQRLEAYVERLPQ
jgi:aspartate/methionine/tyrosine aminotransferase